MLQRLEEENRKTEQQKLDQTNFAWRLKRGAMLRSIFKTARLEDECRLLFEPRKSVVIWNGDRVKPRSKRQQQSQDTRDRAMDRRYMEKARQEERARIALDAIRHAHCTFVVNPFAGLLDH